MSAPETIRPKLVGARVARTEDPRLLTGQGLFADDHQPRGLVHVALVRSPHAHARIRAIDTRAARALNGVLDIVTAADLAVAPIRATSRMKGFRETPMPVLAADVVRYVGEPIAAVVATSRYLAEDAARLVELDCEPLAAAVDPQAALAADAPLLWPELRSNVIVAREFSRGDAAGEAARAPIKVGARFRFHRKAVLALENRSYFAEYSAGRGELVLHASTQVPGIVRESIAELTGMPANRVRVIAADVGGGFGGKTSVYPEELLVAALARRLGRPVKYSSDRLEDLLSTSQSFDEIIDAQLAVDADGRIVALSAEVIGDVGAYSVYPWTAGIEPVQVVSFLPGPYRVEHYHASVRCVATPKPPMGPFRGVGRPIAAFVMERLIDMAAAAVKLDPIEMRARNLVQPAEFPYKAASGIVWDRSGFIESLQAARDSFGYAAQRAAQARQRAAGRLVGIGVACYAELTGLGSKLPAAPGMPVNTGTETATVRIDASGAVTAIFGVANHGQGLETTLGQVVADQLGVPLETVRVITGDTDGRPYTTGTYASRGAVLAGGAGTLAARKVRERLLRLAAHVLEAAAEDLDIEAGAVFVRGTDRKVTIRELARSVYIGFGRLPKELQQELEATELYDPVVGTTSSATHIARVEVDPVTFKVSVTDYSVAEDCGKVINPMIVDGQVHGGVAQGIGAALFEELVFDTDGQLLSGSLMDYLVPSACDVPTMQVAHVEMESPSTLGGYRGMGEGGTIGAPAAIANAIADALGVAVNELPATPERLFQLLNKEA